MTNPTLPLETKDFSEGTVQGGGQGLPISQYERLHAIELRDVDQQITMRPIVAIFFGLLLIVQNCVVFKMVWWALQNDKLSQLQLVFATLMAASLTETYKISQLIVNKLFEPIDYANKHERFNK